MKKSIKPLILTMFLVMLYLVGGVVALKFVPSEFLRSADEHLDLLRRLTASLVIITALFRICVEKLRGEPLSSLLTWFFVVACGAVLIKDSWVILAFLGVILLVLLLVDDTAGSKSEKRGEAVQVPLPNAPAPAPVGQETQFPVQPAYQAQPQPHQPHEGG